MHEAQVSGNDALTGSAKQLFERRSSEATSQSSLPPIATKGQMKGTAAVSSPKPAKHSEGGSGRADEGHQQSPFKVHNKPAAVPSGKHCLDLSTFPIMPEAQYSFLGYAQVQKAIFWLVRFACLKPRPVLISCRMH